MPEKRFTHAFPPGAKYPVGDRAEPSYYGALGNEVEHAIDDLPVARSSPAACGTRRAAHRIRPRVDTLDTALDCFRRSTACAG
jgi:hypothetical protein